MTKSRIAVLTVLVAVSLTVLLAGGMAVTGQDPNMMNSNTSQRNSNGMNQNSGSMMQGLSAQDRRFAREAAAGGMAEVMMARLALQRASTDAVRQYAQQMIDDHTRAGEELQRVATAKGITLPTEPYARQRQSMTQLEGLSGAEFDRAYMQQAGVRDHQTMERLYQREIERGTDAEIKAFATATLPTVQMHLRMAQGMAGGTTGGGNMNGNMNSNMRGNMNGNMNMNRNMNMNGNMNDNMGMNSNGNMNDNMGMDSNMNMGGNMNSNRNMNGNMNGNMNRNMNGNMNRNMNGNMNSNTNGNTNGNMNDNMSRS